MEVLTELLSVIYQQSWLIRKITAGWRLVIVMPICKTGQEDEGNHRPLNLTPVLVKAMESRSLHIPCCSTAWLL